MKCLPGCQCGKHSSRTPEVRDKIAATLRESSKCATGCTCGKHSEEANYSYGSNHARVRAVRGKASTHTCECGKPACDWATIHGASGNDPLTDFIPLCKKCHTQYDDIAGKLRGKPRPDDVREKIRQANTGKTVSDTARRNMSIAHIGIIPSAITRERMSAGQRVRQREGRGSDTERRSCTCGKDSTALGIGRHISAAARRGEAGHELVESR